MKGIFQMKTLLLSSIQACLVVMAIIGAYALVTMNQKHWCEIEYKTQPKYVAECTYVDYGISRVSFK